MAVSRVAITSGAPANASAFSPTLPSHAAGDRLILYVGGKYNTTTIPTINQSWVLLGSGTGGTGSTGNDSGQTFWAVYAIDATSGSMTAPTVTPGGTAPNSWEWIAATYRPGSGKAWLDSITTSAAWVRGGSDTNTTGFLTASVGSFAGQPTAGDAIAAFGTIPTDSGSAIGATSGLSTTGLSGGTVTKDGYVENALGADSASVHMSWEGFTGTGSGGTTPSFAITGATPLAGTVCAVALRETTPFVFHPVADASSPAVVKATSANAVTSASFTPPNNSVIVVGFTSDQQDNVTNASTITDSAGLSWTEHANRRSNNPSGADDGKAALWTAKVTTGSAMTVTCDDAETQSVPKMLIVRVYADTEVDINDPIGGLVQGSIAASSATVQASVTPETTGGGLRLLVLDWNATGIPTAFLPNNTDTNLVDAFHNAGLSTNVQIGKSTETTASSAETIGYTVLSGTTSDGNYIAYELRAPQTAVTGTVSQSFGFDAPATGIKIVQGTVNQNLGFSTTVSGVKIVQGAVNQNLGFAAPAVGVPVKTGTISDNFGFTAPAVGAPVKLGTISDNFGFTAPASGVPIKTGTVSQNLGFDAPASGVPVKVGTVSQSFGFDALATGTVLAPVTGTVSQSFGFDAPAAGTVVAANVVTGAASDNFGFTAPASGTKIVTGSVNQHLGFSDSVSGSPVKLGSVSQSFGFAAPASGVKVVQGTASQSFGFTASATGVPVKLGSISDSFGFTAPASGSKVVTGSATDSFGFSAPADGSRIVTGTSTGSFGFDAPADATRLVEGIVGQSFGFDAPATGNKVVTGAISQSFGFDAPATGLAITPGIVSGTVSQSFGFDASASGSKVVTGSVNQHLGFSDTVSGSPVKLGAVTQSFGFSAPASGTKVVTGQSLQSLGFTAPASGTVTGANVVNGTVSQTFGFNGAGVGTKIVQGSVNQHLGFSSVVDGAPVKLGSSSCNFGFDAPAAGVPIVLGASTCDLGFDAPATGTSSPANVVTGVIDQSFGFTAPASGFNPSSIDYQRFVLGLTYSDEPPALVLGSRHRNLQRLVN